MSVIRLAGGHRALSADPGREPLDLAQKFEMRSHATSGGLAW